ncbi:hypothetical protein EBU24_01740 [bacterium]|nr:hypothetical protein [bacterium]
MRIKSLVLALCVMQSASVMASESALLSPLKSLNDLSIKGQAWSLTKSAAGMTFVVAKKLASLGLKFEKDLFLADKKAFILFNLLMAFPAYCACKNVKSNIELIKKQAKKLYSKLKCMTGYTLSVVLVTAATSVAYGALTAKK